MSKNFLKKIIYIFLGSISLILGIIGIFIPILPTTPFLLLTAFFYLKSSHKLYSWLINHRIFGEYIYNYITHKSIKKNTKISALLFLWGTLGLSFFMTDNIHLRIFLIMVGIGVSMHLLLLKTLK